MDRSQFCRSNGVEDQQGERNPQGLGFRIWGLGFRVQNVGLGFRSKKSSDENKVPRPSKYR